MRFWWVMTKFMISEESFGDSTEDRGSQLSGKWSPTDWTGIYCAGNDDNWDKYFQIQVLSDKLESRDQKLTQMEYELSKKNCHVPRWGH